MKHSTETNINLTHSHDLLEHMPKAFQTMARIEQMAQARFCEIMASIERGETTLEDVKRQGVFLILAKTQSKAVRLL